MSDPSSDPGPPAALGITDPSEDEGITTFEVVAIALSLIWVIGAGVFFLAVPRADDPAMSALETLVLIVALLLPLAMIWAVAMIARAHNRMRDENRRLQASMDAIRQTYVAQAQATHSTPDPSLEKRLDEIAKMARRTETTLEKMTQAAVPALAVTAEDPEPKQEEVQPSLDLGSPAGHQEASSLTIDDFVAALNFPETASDSVGFAALHKARQDRPTAQLLQAAEDMLTLLSQEGIYMDDLMADQAKPEFWRRFAEGERGGILSVLGGIREEDALEKVERRMKDDPIFRDVAHHFLRIFDRNLTYFAEVADDAEIARLSNTRTARAFMLLGRVAGTFH